MFRRPRAVYPTYPASRRGGLGSTKGGACKQDSPKRGGEDRHGLSVLSRRSSLGALSHSKLPQSVDVPYQSVSRKSRALYEDRRTYDPWTLH